MTTPIRNHPELKKLLSRMRATTHPMLVTARDKSKRVVHSHVQFVQNPFPEGVYATRSTKGR